jgi:hypothetical protein
MATGWRDRPKKRPPSAPMTRRRFVATAALPLAALWLPRGAAARHASLDRTHIVG